MVQQILYNRREADKPYRTFTESWRDLAERFLSALWHDPSKGCEAAIKAGLRPESFPEPWLCVLARLLVACGTLGYDHNTGFKKDDLNDGFQGYGCKTGFICRALRDLGEHVEGPDLEAIKWRHASGVSVDRYALLLADRARRRGLYDRLGLMQQLTLDECEPVGNVTEKVLSDITAFQKDGSSLPEPPALSRPPVIHVTHTLRMAERISA